jgi:hypothetical protein
MSGEQDSNLRAPTSKVGEINLTPLPPDICLFNTSKNCLFLFVGMAGFEPAYSSSQTMRDKPDSSTSRSLIVE